MIRLVVVFLCLVPLGASVTCVGPFNEFESLSVLSNVSTAPFEVERTRRCVRVHYMQTYEAALVGLSESALCHSVAVPGSVELRMRQFRRSDDLVTEGKTLFLLLCSHAVERTLSVCCWIECI
jgi:hypothetical protein